MPLTRPLGGIAAVILTTTCAPQPHPAAAVELPAAWKSAAGFRSASPERDYSRWWNRFDDPQLPQVVSAALHSNPDIASGIARIREARALRQATAAALFPAVDAGGSVNSRRTHSQALGSTSTTSYNLGVDAAWEVDWFGKNRGRVEAATANVGLATENFHSLQAALAAETASAYANLRANEARLDVLRKTVKTREQTTQLANWRLQAGEADRLEYDQVLTSLEQARAAIPSLEQATAQNRNQVALLCGRQPGSMDQWLSSRRKAIPNPARKLAVGIPADTLRQRPDVRAAGYQIIAAAARTNAAAAERFPSLRLSGSLGLDALKAAKIFDPQTTSANILAGITSPIFDAGRIRANIAAAAAVEEQMIHAYRASVLTALSETEDALLACRGTAERLVILERAIVVAREANQLAQQRYQAGEIDFLDVLDAERTLLALEDNLISTRTDRTLAYIQLYKALGGGWAGA